MEKTSLLSPTLAKQELIAYLLGFLLWIPFGVIFLPFYLILFIIRSIVHILAKIFRSDLIPLSKVDVLFAHAPSYSPDSDAYTAQVWKVKGEVDVVSFRNHFQQTFLSTEEDRRKYANLYCYFVNFLGYTFKKKVDRINLHKHIQTLTLKEDQTLESFLGQWIVTHDFKRNGEEKGPEWMVKIIANHSKQSTTVLFKLHHGICDGYTIVHLVGKLSGEHAPYAFKEPMPPLLKRIKCLAQFPYLITELWMQIAQNYGKRLVSHITPNEEIRFHDNDANDDVRDWMISFCRLDLETVKAIRRVTGTKFVSVLMSVHIGALKRLMLDLCLDEEDCMRRIDKTFIFHSMGWPKHPTMTGAGGMTNHLSLGIIKASLNIDDPLERLLNLNTALHEVKQKGHSILIYYAVFNLLKLHPSCLNTLLVKANLSIVGAETFLSNLMCSSKPHYLMGKPVEELYLPVVSRSKLKSLKLLTVPVSHSGVLDISFNASRKLVRNQEMLDRLAKIYFPYELEQLRKRTGQIID